jgi:hypothetical protein
VRMQRNLPAACDGLHTRATRAGKLSERLQAIIATAMRQVDLDEDQPVCFRVHWHIADAALGPAVSQPHEGETRDPMNLPRYARRADRLGSAAHNDFQSLTISGGRTGSAPVCPRPFGSDDRKIDEAGCTPGRDTRVGSP